MDIAYPIVIYLKHNFSETGFSLRLWLEPEEVGPIDIVSLSLSLSLSGLPSQTLRFNKHWTMDDVHNCDSYIFGTG
jgi:hypothetical protein